jgi:hypothetical protein
MLAKASLVVVASWNSQSLLAFRFHEAVSAVFLVFLADILFGNPGSWLSYAQVLLLLGRAALGLVEVLDLGFSFLYFRNNKDF